MSYSPYVTTFCCFRDEITNIPLKSAISSQAKASKFSLVLWLYEIVGLAAISNRKNV